MSQRYIIHFKHPLLNNNVLTFNYSGKKGIADFREHGFWMNKEGTAQTDGMSEADIWIPPHKIEMIEIDRSGTEKVKYTEERSVIAEVSKTPGC